MLLLLLAACLAQADSAPPLITADVELHAPPLPPPAPPLVTAEVQVRTPALPPPPPAPPASPPPPMVSAEVEVHTPRVAGAAQLEAAPHPVAVSAQVESPSRQVAISAQAQTPPPARSNDEPSDVPAFHLSALAVGGLVLGSEGNAYTAGALAEVDIFRFGAFFAYDRGISSAWAISDTQQYTGMLGYSLFASSWGRVRVLGGVNVLAAATGLKVAPVLGTSVRVGFRFLALEGAATFTPAVFRELDARAALVLCAGAFEVRAGYRARVSDSSAAGTLSTLFASPLAAGPFLALGFTL